jgi:hypothetical protein
MTNASATKGGIVITSSFSNEAYAFADRNPIQLIDGNHLIPLMNKHLGSRRALEMDFLPLQSLEPGVHSHPAGELVTIRKRGVTPVKSRT